MPNRLAQAQSLYLQKHAENPIDWWPWCDEALETARQRNQPIFLSVGYSSCHWCTVMEGEAFSDLAIAEYLNAQFLPIKVDREERPDLDSIYMQALQMMTGQGGWPLNIFITPDDLVPFYGSTYFPIEPRYGRPGFLQVLQAIRQYYDNEPDKLAGIKTAILQNLQSAVLLSPLPSLEIDLLKQGLDYSVSVLATKSVGPSFPMIPYADAALRATQFNRESRYDAPSVTTQRGLDLALGGIFDHVAGGFHRYTVDPTWTVPHFEKMLYDNGQIVEYLANLWAMGVQEPAFERAIDLTVQWLRREMTAPAGYFYAAQDADNFTASDALEPEEGAFYVWTYAELQQLLSPSELTELAAQFAIIEAGNFEGSIVLQRQQPGRLSTPVETALGKLFHHRYGAAAAALPTCPPAINNQMAKTTPWLGRIPPVTDTKMIVAWNSLMISGLARAAAVWQKPGYLAPAIAATQFILQNQWVNDRCHRLNYDGKAEVLAQSEDYALFIKALLDLHQATLANSANPDNPPTHHPRAMGESPMHSTASEFDWLTQAIRVQREFDEFLWSVELGGYYNTARDTSRDLIIRERSYIDNATPAANGVAIANLIRLSLCTADLDYLDKAEQSLHAFGHVMKTTPQACPTLFSALDWFYHPTLVRTTPDRLTKIVQKYLPTVVGEIVPDLPADAIALVCQGLSCQAPVASTDQLWEQITASQTRLTLAS